MSRRDSFLLRIDPKVLEAIRKWAGDELRSTNGQIEYLLRKSLMDAGRWRGGQETDGGQRSKGTRG